jgi:hypothetical protein
MSRLHSEIAIEGKTDPNSPAFRSRFEGQLQTAIQEYSQASASAFTRKLWELEGQRLLRTTRNYGSEWAEFKNSWQSSGCNPEPAIFEKAFGFKEGIAVDAPVTTPALTIERQGLTAKVGGRIDRVDTAKVGKETLFWVIDYKTGMPGNYSLAMFQKMERLQLTLYALAAQKLFFPNSSARPLGLVYWFVAHKEGMKTVFPKQKKIKGKYVIPGLGEWNAYVERLEGWVLEIVTRIRSAMFPLAPREEKSCIGCPYSQSCRISQSRNLKKDWTFSLPSASAPGGDEE